MNKVHEINEYVAGKTFEYVMQTYGFKREEITRLAGNESTLGTSPAAVEAARQAAAESNYYDEPRSESLMQILENKLRAEGLNMDKLGVVVGNGMDSVIDHLLMLTTNKNSSVINLSPTFIYYEFTASRHGLEVIEVPRTASFAVDIDEIFIQVKDNTRLVFLCSPNNPDGSVVSLEDIERLAAWLQKSNIILFVDHAYIDFTDGGKYDARSLVESYPNMVIGYTFSKAYAMAGYRVGYGLMSRELQERYLQIMTPFQCAKPSLAAAKAALEDKVHLQRIIDNNIEGKKFLTKELHRFGYKVYDSEANFLLFEGDDEADQVVEKLMSRGVIIRAIPSVNSKALRVTIGSPAENQSFMEALCPEKYSMA